MMRAFAAATAALLAACFNPTFQDTTCGPNDECPPGLTCSGGVCRPPGAPIDAEVDGPEIDAPIDAIDAPVDAPVDAIDAPTGPCNPLAAPGMQGCAGDEKCTWVRVQETPTELGSLECVPDGIVALGGACVTGPTGATTGYDDCAAGGICIGGKCLDICGLVDTGAPGAACASGYNCVQYSGLFANAPDPAPYGGCNELCDPVTQLLTSGQACPASQGCYLLTSSETTIAVCAGAGSIGHNQPITGTPFANSCLPGHRPRFRTQGGSTYECGALCRPAAVSQGMNVGAEGGVAPYTCESKGAAPPSNTTQGESCRFYWSQETFTQLSPFSNTTGLCFKHAIYQYDSNNDGTPDTPFPRCPNLTLGDVLPPIMNPPGNDALDFWCQPKTASVTSAAPGAMLDRLAPPR